MSFMVFQLLSVASVFAISVTITPAGNSHTSVADQSCGQNIPAQFTVNDNGNGGVLCWYYTNEDTTKVKLTPTCVRPGTSASNLNAYVRMPSSGSKIVTVQLECFDFWNVISDTCQDSYSYDNALTNKYSCANANGIGCGGNTIAPRYWDLSCAAITFTISPSQGTLNLLNGKSQTVTITVTNTMSSYPINCDQGIGSVSAGGSNTNYKVTVTAPSTGSGQTTQTATVTCTWQGGTSSTQSTVITVNYQSNPCDAALADARTGISDAQTAISSAQSKIKEANDLGADVTAAQASLNQANSDLLTAQSGLATAQSTCNSGNTATGASQANNAKTSASQAQTEATNALNSAQQAVTTFQQKKTDASNKISDANSALDNTGLMANKADNVLQNATALNAALPQALGGLDLVSQKSNIATARAKLDQARQYIKDAQTAFDQKNFDSAKSKADSALQLANDANSLATDSFTKINTVMGTLGVAANDYLTASSEISQTDGILTKMDYVIRSVEKWGVNLGEAKQITSDGKSSIDQAKDLLSQAKNRLQSGSTDASAKAIEARDKAAEPANRLNRIVSSINTQTQSAMEKALSDASGRINSAEANVNGAAGTYMATQSEVIAAQNDLTSAKSYLSNATSASKGAAQAIDLTSFLDKASVTFSALEQLQSKVQSADTHANNAKLGLYTTVGGAGAVAAGAAGGGFLFWRKKRKSQPAAEGTKKKESDERTEKAEKPTDKKGEHRAKGKPKGNFCGNCRMRVEQSVKFCPRCGKRI